MSRRAKPKPRARRRTTPDKSTGGDLRVRGDRFLERADAARQLAGTPAARRSSVEAPAPGRPALGAPLLGSAAKLAAAVLLLRHAEHEELMAGDRLRIVASTTCSADAIAHAQAELEEVRERTTAARARVAKVKQEIHEQRIAHGLHSNGKAARVLRQLGLADDARLVPFGAVPAPGARRKAVAVPTKPSDVEQLVDKILKTGGRDVAS